MNNKPPRKIGFRTSYDKEIEFEEMKQINTEEQEDDQIVVLDDFIPGAVYDGQGNIVSQKSFNAKIKKLKAEARNLNWTALSKLILYTSLGASILLLSYGTYKKYFNTKDNVNKTKIEIINNKTK